MISIPCVYLDFGAIEKLQAKRFGGVVWFVFLAFGDGFTASFTDFLIGSGVASLGWSNLGAFVAA